MTGTTGNLLRRGAVVSAHVLLWTAGYAGAYLLRFEGTVPPSEVVPAIYGLGVLLLFRVSAFWWAGLFHGILRYAGIPEIVSIVRMSTISTAMLVLSGVLYRPLLLPRSIYAGEWLLALFTAAGLRLTVRIVQEYRQTSRSKRRGKRALLLGAGDAGELLLRDLRRRPADIDIVAILDDNPALHGSTLHGTPVLGPISGGMILRSCERLETTLAILALPHATGERTRSILDACMTAGMETKTLPSLEQILNGEVHTTVLRDVAIDDLLRRAPIVLDQASMSKFLRGKRVLITGGAGSIGSELARQATQHGPAKIALLDHDENALFFLERELSHAHPRTAIEYLVGDIKDSQRVAEVLRTIQPHVVLHAAAHKHVPLMESNPVEAIKNNAFGTRIVADLADAHGVDTFVLISTDKAVRPTSVMGATKRLAEMYLQAKASAGARTRFAAVRFGNVLGSAGSVVQVFKRQIEQGGPITVTHPDMRRYFMTIPEACQLVLQAGALAEGGELFMLDMGEPVRIMDLAEDMIRMSGCKDDVQIEITGIRPGEKLFEELWADNEEVESTAHPKIVRGRVTPPSMDLVEAGMASLAQSVTAPALARATLAKLVPEAALTSTPSNAEVDGTLRALEPLVTL